MKNRFKQFIKQFLGPWLRKRHRNPGFSPERWQLGYQEQQLQLKNRSLASMAEEYGSPLHVVNAEKLRHNVSAIQDARSPSGLRCELYYSYKTNPIPGVLAEMHAMGVGAEGISHYEMWLAEHLNVPSENRIYNGPAKSEESIIQAIEEPIRVINANSVSELKRIESIAKRCGKPARVGLRVAAPGGWSGQFGLNPDEAETWAAFEYAEQSQHLTLLGLHVHRGIAIRDEGTLRNFVDGVLGYWHRLKNDHGIHIELIDFGGSLACPTYEWISPRDHKLAQIFLADVSKPSPCLTPAEYAQVLLDTVERNLSNADIQQDSWPAVISEPGRGLTSNTQFLICQVLDIKPHADGYSHVVLDAGINLAESMRSEHHQIFPLQQSSSGEKQFYRLVGPICTPGDVICNAIELPTLSVGDRLAIMDSGAYFVPFSTSFSYPQPGIVMADGDKVRSIRRPETFEDIIHRDNVGE